LKHSEYVHGVWCAALTPVNPDGSVANARFAEHAKHLLASGVDGIAPFGTTGEGQSFSVAQRRSSVDALLAAGIPAQRLLPATGCAAIADTIELTRHAVDAGCAGVLVLPPFFFKGVGDDGVFATYRALIEGVNDSRLRVYLYHIPQVTSVPIGFAAIERLLAEFPGVVVGIKDSAGNLDHSLELVDRFPALNVFVGHEPHLPQLLDAGGAGTVCGLANLYPQVLRRLHDATTEVARQEELVVLAELIAALKPHSLMPALKAIRFLQTGDARWLNVRPPLVALDEAARRRIASAISSFDTVHAAAA
jgi:4-hydroxy-tetrahydrodipicolinate synthase